MHLLHKEQSVRVRGSFFRGRMTEKRVWLSSTQLRQRVWKNASNVIRDDTVWVGSFPTHFQPQIVRYTCINAHDKIMFLDIPLLGIFHLFNFRNVRTQGETKRSLKCIQIKSAKFWQNRKKRDAEGFENIYDFFTIFPGFFGTRSLQKWTWFFSTTKIRFYMIFWKIRGP